MSCLKSGQMLRHCCLARRVPLAMVLLVAGNAAPTIRAATAAASAGLHDLSPRSRSRQILGVPVHHARRPEPLQGADLARHRSASVG